MIRRGRFPGVGRRADDQPSGWGMEPLWGFPPIQHAPGRNPVGVVRGGRGRFPRGRPSFRRPTLGLGDGTPSGFPKNPNGISSPSPGLRRPRRYPGNARPRAAQPHRGCVREPARPSFQDKAPPSPRLKQNTATTLIRRLQFRLPQRNYRRAASRRTLTQP